MNNNMTDKKRYKLSNEIVSVNDENNINNNIIKEKIHIIDIII